MFGRVADTRLRLLDLFPTALKSKYFAIRNSFCLADIQGAGKVPWTEQEVFDHAADLKLSLPLTIKELILSPEWQGGLIQLDNDISRPTADDCIVNYIWLRPFVSKFPETVCSGYYAADVFKALDVLVENKLLKSPDPMDTKKSLALEEGGRMKRLMGGLRYLWRSSASVSVNWDIQFLLCCVPLSF